MLHRRADPPCRSAMELGLAQTQDQLVRNGLRSRSSETDGKLMSGRDVAIAALLGRRSSASPPVRSSPWAA
ncbi:MAG: glutamate synthase-related protein [Merdibacter sp.]